MSDVPVTSTTLRLRSRRVPTERRRPSFLLFRVYFTFAEAESFLFRWRASKLANFDDERIGVGHLVDGAVIYSPYRLNSTTGPVKARIFLLIYLLKVQLRI